ncbi:NTE family protein [Thermomonospora echinospora]|uniref:NTE family protein n=1 Tax=Thermomonospora echinospora TaxID=1992 RepID=A0A1H6CBY8_9ACTN|nr:patatin-like phospholipase family protein [Thermomonospora echinospora]SEG69906.1 NTE family protein [Thermomonospora echinospora]
MTMNGGRALVLGGGGVAGIAWEAGLLAGLAEQGVDLTGADLFVGTSAGSVVGSFAAHGADMTEAVRRMSARAEGDGRGTAPADVDLNVVLQAFAILYDASLDPQEARARVGRMALEAETEAMAAVLEEVGTRLPSQEWPDRRLLITGVDVEDGSFVVWDGSSSVPLALAVRASCTVPCVFPPVAIDGRRYMDGGCRSVTNADLAKGAAAVVIVEPMAHLTPRATLEKELAELGDARTVAIGPDQATMETFGADLLSPKLWGPAFDAGLRQASAVTDDVRKAWEPSV